MTALYEINKSIIDLMDQWQQSVEASEQEPTQTLDFELEFAKLQIQFNEKIDNICKYIRNIETDTDGIDAEIDRLYKIKKSNERKIDRLEAYITSSMQSQGLEKTETGLFKLSFRKSVSLEIIDESKIPDQFKEKIESIKIDKVPLKKWLEDEAYYAVEENWCELVLKQNLQIK